VAASAASSAPTAADETSADEARRRLHEQGIVAIEPDDRIGPLLEPDELVLAVRRSASLERRQRCRDDAPGLSGDLYVTTRRLVHIGRASVAYRLDEILEADVGASHLLLVVAESRGVTIQVADPRLLRVEIAAARSAARGEGRHELAP
jgi:6-phosphofructokinase